MLWIKVSSAIWFMAEHAYGITSWKSRVSSLVFFEEKNGLTVGGLAIFFEYIVNQKIPRLTLRLTSGCTTQFFFYSRHDKVVATMIQWSWFQSDHKHPETANKKPWWNWQIDNKKTNPRHAGPPPEKVSLIHTFSGGDPGCLGTHGFCFHYFHHQPIFVHNQSFGVSKIPETYWMAINEFPRAFARNPCGCFLKWWYPQNTPKWSFLVL